jgi:chromate reductase
VTAFRITALSGSLRASSTNTALLREVAARAPNGVVVELFPLGDLSLFNPDLQGDLPDAAANFRAVISASDALIIASPEYAHGISGVMKNALDWLVGCEGFAGKPVLILNAAPRAHHALTALRETLCTMAAKIVENPSFEAGLMHAIKEGSCHAAHA